LTISLAIDGGKELMGRTKEETNNETTQKRAGAFRQTTKESNSRAYIGGEKKERKPGRATSIKKGIFTAVGRKRKNSRGH